MWRPNNETSTEDLFEIAAMPFPCNGILLIQGNFPRFLSVLGLKIASCLIPYIDSFLNTHLGYLLNFIFAFHFDVKGAYLCLAEVKWVKTGVPGLYYCFPRPSPKQADRRCAPKGLCASHRWQWIIFGTIIINYQVTSLNLVSIWQNWRVSMHAGKRFSFVKPQRTNMCI